MACYERSESHSEPSEYDYESAESDSEPSESGYESAEFVSEPSETGYESAESKFKLRGWVSSMKSMFGSLESEAIKACSISGVPEQYRKSEKESEAYKPKVVSVGPLYRGTKTELLHMEEIKYRCMMSLLLRTEDPGKYFAKCCKVILQLDMAVRAFYVDDIKLDNYDLAKIMVLDGCFLLELLIRHAEKSNPRIFGESYSSEYPPADVKKLKEVISDLQLLGNQIPLLVLNCLFQLLFARKFTEFQTYTNVRNMINHLVLLYFGYTDDTTSNSVTDSPNRAHILDIVHRFTTNHEYEDKIVPESSHYTVTIDEDEDKIIPESSHYSLTIDEEEDKLVPESNHSSTSTETSKKRNCKTKPEPKWCAYRLLSNGITISPPEEQSKKRNDPPERVTFDCYKSFRFSFSKGILEIQPLTITKEMEIQWRNFIAWEQNRIIHEKYIGKKSDQTSCKFSECALLLKGLVCCEHDIKQLKKKGVIVADEKWSNEDLMNFFRTIAGGIPNDTSQLYYKMIQTLRPNSGAGRNFSLFWLWHKFRRVLINTRYALREMFATLKHDHTPTVWKTIGVVAAAMLLFLTVAQTVFAAIGL